MGKGFYISKSIGVVAVVLGAGALATIIALSVVYSQEKAKNNDVLPTTTPTTPTTSEPPVSVSTPAPPSEAWDKYRLPKSLVPDHYNVTLWPRLTPDQTTGLYIFTGKASATVSVVTGFQFRKCNHLTFSSQSVLISRAAADGRLTGP